MTWPRLTRTAAQAALWLVTILIGLSMFDAGIGKFQDAAGWQHWFVEVWGYPVWFRALIGGVEMAGAVLLLWPRVASYAAGGLIIVMIGALVTVTTKPTDLSWVDPLLNSVLLMIVLAGRWSVRSRIQVRPPQSG